MKASNYDELARHVGHFIECVTHPDGRVALECVMCAQVLYDLEDEVELPREALAER